MLNIMKNMNLLFIFIVRHVVSVTLGLLIFKGKELFTITQKSLRHLMISVHDNRMAQASKSVYSGIKFNE